MQLDLLGTMESTLLVRHTCMRTTLDLLRRVLEEQTNVSLALKLHVYSSAFSKARERGPLSPILAGQVACQLGEDVVYWTAIAALEAERPGPARDKLIRAIRRARSS